MKIVSLLVFLSAAAGLFAEEPAYREEIITPHWIERHPHVAGPVNALFLVNDLARREPDELGQRFDINVQKVRTLRGSNAYKNVFDLDAFALQLESNPDVLVVSAAKPWKDLGPKGLELTMDWVRNGGRLAVFTRNTAERELEEMSLEAGEMTSLTEEVSARLNLEPVFPGKFRESFSVEQTSLGKGAITFARPFDRAFVRFNAFFPKLGSWDDPDIVRETGYLLAYRIIRRAVGKHESRQPDFDLELNLEGIAIRGDLAQDSELHLQIRSASGQLLTEAATKSLPISVPFGPRERSPFSGKLETRIGVSQSEQRPSLLTSRSRSKSPNCPPRILGTSRLWSSGRRFSIVTIGRSKRRFTTLIAIRFGSPKRQQLLGGSRFLRGKPIASATKFDSF